MFIYNLKFNSKKVVKLLFIIIGIAVAIYFIVSAIKIYSNSFTVKDEFSEPGTISLTAQNYTNILKSVHDDIDSYIGKKINFTGYIYRLSDFKEDEFVLARDMIVSSNMQTLIVGFLCNCKDSKDLQNGIWVEVAGEITKGNYHGELPVIKINKIKQIEKPKEDIYVYPPDDNFIPTSTF